MGRDLVALKVTQNAKARTDNTRPAVLYNAMQHAREWLAGEIVQAHAAVLHEQLRHDARHAGRGRSSPSSSTRASCGSCASTTRTATSTRSRRATGCGARTWPTTTATACAASRSTASTRTATTPRTGASTTRAPPATPLSETYRGPGPDSEPETKAIKGLWDRVDFAFEKNDHTAAALLLWPNGFQQYTPTPDDKLFEAYAGDDDNSAIADKVFDPETEEWEITGNRFDPDIGAELYITNGDLTDDAYAAGILAYTPEGTPSDVENASGFEFQDVEADVEAEFQRHKQFALDLARSADDPADVRSHLGNTVRDFYVESFADSYGDPQPVQVVAKKSLGDVKLRYRINDGPVKTANTAPFAGGERFDQERASSTTACAAPSPGPTLETRSRCGSRAPAGPPRTSPTRRARRPGTRC